MKHYIKKFLKIFIITAVIMLLVAAIAFGGAVLGYWGGIEQIDINSLMMDQNSTIVYTDPDTGEEVELQKLSSEENREWVDIEKIPQNLQNAFISIEDERFMDHNGYDLPRTAKATFTYIGNKLFGRNSATLGGSTITQQLIKNVTGEDDQTPVRKIREISRAVALEKQLEKPDVLELYLNCIYLSRGCNGVQTAARTYFGKDVSELNLAECASIAGITQNPAAYDPIDNPEKNKERQELVLKKMLELGHISQEEYDEAIAYDLEFTDEEELAKLTEPKTTSYYVDQVIRDVLRDLQEQGYSPALANKILYSGGVKVYSSYNPEIQSIVEKYYSNPNNFYGSGIQSAVTVIDVQTGQIVGIAGGIGEKTASLTLNRASQSPRQPGSTIKPIAAYAPAIEKNLITPGTVFEDKAKSYDGWVPRNYDFKYRGNVDVRSALRSSLNTTPVEIISRMGAQESFDFLTEKLGVTTLVASRESEAGVLTDIGLPQLALGGLTDGMTTVELAAAYCPFANGGLYYKPYTYTEVKDKDGNVIISSDRSGKTAMKESTAYTMTDMLIDVVTSGTGRGASVSGVRYTAGKTGTTSDNKDRWFVGYTPYFACAVWYGYDIPKEIYAGGNPCIPVFTSIMNGAHRTLDDRSRGIERPDDLISVKCCTHSGMRATSKCPASSTSYFSKDEVPDYCNSDHKGYLAPTPAKTEEENTTENTDAENTTTEETTETETDDDDATTEAPSTTTGTGTATNTEGTTGGTSTGTTGTTGTTSGSTGTTSGTASSGTASSSGTSGSSGSTGTSSGSTSTPAAPPASSGTAATAPVASE